MGHKAFTKVKTMHFAIRNMLVDMPGKNFLDAGICCSFLYHKNMTADTNLFNDHFNRKRLYGQKAKHTGLFHNTPNPPQLAVIML